MSIEDSNITIWSASSHAVPSADLFRSVGVTLETSDVGVCWSNGNLTALSTLSPRLVTRFGGGSGERLLAELSDPAGRLRAQMVNGLAGEALHVDPSLAAVLTSIEDPQRAVTATSIYNEWIAGFVAADPGHFAGIGLIPATGIDDALTALRSAQASGLRGVTLLHPPGGPGTPPGGEALEFWELAAAGGTVVCLNAAFGGIVPDITPRIAAGEAPPVAGFLPRLAFSGVPDRARSLKLMLVNVEAGWLPHALQNADLNYLRAAASRAVQLSDPDALPSECVRRILWASFHEDRYAVLHRDYFGEHHLLWGSAIPTDDATWPDDEEQASRITAGLAHDTRRRLLSENAMRLFGIGEAAPFTQDEVSRFRLAALR
ncbi:MAG: amidohydrolase family protein [Sphingomonadaceae bacterium]|nr:amidohydrolase family protein [Sphingomonadaceae bacterium]